MLDFGYYNMDCMQGMKEFPDNYFDLAIVDPPYGGGGSAFASGTRFGERFARYNHKCEIRREGERVREVQEKGNYP